MGEIIIKVPGDIKKVFFTIDEALIELREFKNIEMQKEALEFILKNAGKLKEEDLPSEEEIYWQEDEK